MNQAPPPTLQRTRIKICGLTREQDIDADLHHHAEDHRGHRDRREPQREMHDAGHELSRGLEPVLEALPALLRQPEAGGSAYGPFTVFE